MTTTFRVTDKTGTIHAEAMTFIGAHRIKDQLIERYGKPFEVKPVKS